MSTKLEGVLRTQGREWKTVARDFAEATKDSLNDKVVYLRARVRFLEEQDKQLLKALADQ